MDSDIIYLSDEETAIREDSPPLEVSTYFDTVKQIDSALNLQTVKSGLSLPLTSDDANRFLNIPLLSTESDAKIAETLKTGTVMSRLSSVSPSSNANSLSFNGVQKSPLQPVAEVFNPSGSNVNNLVSSHTCSNEEWHVKRTMPQRTLEERVRKKKEFELAKKMSKFHRELSVLKKSKCEQNLFCVIDSSVCSSFDGLAATLRQIFMDRRIGEQLIFDDKPGMNICWKRRHLEAQISDGQFMQTEKLVFEKFCMMFMTGDEFKQLNKSATFFQRLKTVTEALPFSSPQLIVVVYGANIVNSQRVAQLLLEAYELYRTQLRFVNSVYEMGILVARTHRSIAKLLWQTENKAQTIFETEKGMKEDWWSKMLKHTFRLRSDQQRALVNRFPEPFALCNQLSQMEISVAIRFLANIQTDEGRRIGPAIARKIFYVLTSRDGSEVVDE